jgi:hypothetical protein
MCGIEKRDSVSYPESSMLVFGDPVDSDDRNEILLDQVVDQVALNSSGIETRRFREAQLFASTAIL